MRPKKWIITASGAAVIAAGSAATAVSAGAANTLGAAPVQKTIELANNRGEEFAPPPADAAPKLTVQQA